jgi:hypothetical protein
MKKLYDEPYFEVLRFLLEDPLCVSDLQDNNDSGDDSGEDKSNNPETPMPEVGVEAEDDYAPETPMPVVGVEAIE